jgi:prepilin-type processing-associated H-X9-DG protein
MRIYLSLLCVVFLGAAAKAGDGDKIKIIAPYVDDQTFLVAHVDVSRVDVEVVAKYLEALGAEDVNQAKDIAALAKSKFLKAGGKDLYVLMNWARPMHEFLVVVPIGKEGGRQLVRAAETMGAAKDEVAFLVGDEALVAGPKKLTDALVAFEPKAVPDLARAFGAVGDGAVRIVFMPPNALRRAFFEMFPELPREVGGGKTAVLKVQWAAVRFDVGDAVTAKFVAQASDAKSADEIGKVLERALDFAGRSKEIEHVFPDFAKMARLLTPKVQDDRLTLTLGDRDLKDVLLPLVAKRREAARRAESVNNLKQIGLAMHNFHDTHKAFPAASTYDAKGKPLLSWRVYLLPYVEQDALFRQFRLNEPWDSPHNKKLIGRMPPVYKSPLQKNVEAGKTTYLAPVGPKTIFGGKKGMPIQKIVDGTSNTIMVVDADDSRAVFWTQPEDYKIDAKNPMAGLVRQGTHGFNALFADGSVHFIPAATDAATLRALFTASGGEVIQLP